jgi:hypothetical protein
MDLQDLNKSQLILLAVLISFITSIATGITTVTLMQQAPSSFTVPVNRVIKQTVEKIQQVEGKTTIETVVIKEEDLVVDAIAKNKSAVFFVTKEGQDANFNNAEVPAGVGFAVSNDGILAVDAKFVPREGEYYVRNESGKFRADFVSTNNAGFSFLKVKAPVNGTDKLVLAVPQYGDVEKMKIGQKILVFGRKTTSSIFDGLDENKNMDLSVSEQNGGGLVLNLDGEALGMALYSNSSSFVSIKTIEEAVKLLNTSSN